MLKRVVAVFLCAIFLIALVVGFRTAQVSDQRFTDVPLSPIAVNSPAALTRFAGALRIQTISEPLQPPNAGAMQELRDYLQRSFPGVHHAMRRELAGDSALLFTWQGSDPSLTPILFLGHMDVVPVDPNRLSSWKYPPFDGQIADGFIWGRGSMDDKQAVLSLMEASESLLQEGFKPRRSIYFAFGDDEENDGHGAEALCALLRSRNVHPRFVLDEGGQISRGVIPGVRADVALIGVAEKGIVSIRMTVNAIGGHSSRPPMQTAIGILSRAVARLEAHQMPARLNGVTARMLDSLSSKMDLGQRIMVRNQWLFGRILLHSLGETANGNALIRTTTAVTMFNSGIKDNVLPAEATAVVNFRILPGDTVASVLEHIRDVVADNRVTISPYGELAADPSPISPIDAPSYSILQQTIHQFFPNAIVSPNLLVARTDSARYYAITQNVYRFFPAVRDQSDFERIHGTNERLATDGYLNSIQFMAALMRRQAQ